MNNGIENPGYGEMFKTPGRECAKKWLEETRTYGHRCEAILAARKVFTSDEPEGIPLNVLHIDMASQTQKQIELTGLCKLSGNFLIKDGEKITRREWAQLSTKHGEVPHVVPEPVKLQHEFLKEYSILCKKYGMLIKFNQWGESLEIETVEYNNTDINNYITSIDLQ